MHDEILVLEKIKGVIYFNQKVWLKPYIDMNTELRKKKLEITPKKNFFKLIDNSVNHWCLIRHKDIKLVTTEKIGNCLVSELTYHTSKFFSKNLLGIKIKKQILMNKPVYLDLSIL